MSQIERIRDMLADGYTPTEVKETLGVSYPTIRKYAQEDDFSPQRPKASERPSKLDPYKALIGEMQDKVAAVAEKTATATTSSATRPSASSRGCAQSMALAAATPRCSAT